MKKLFELRYLFLISAISVVLATGCGKKLPPHRTTYKVHGKVTLNGSPVSGNELYFQPDDYGPNGGLDGRAPIDEQGNFSASSYVDQEGLVPGSYKVRIGELGGGPGAKTTNIPKKYQEILTSELTFIVKPEENTYDIDLK